MANLNHGELDGKRILKASTYDLMWKPAGEKFAQIGICWFLREYRGHRTIGHSGGDVGFVSNLVLVPDRGIGVIMMSNFDRAPLGPLTNAALDVALGLKPDQPVIKTPITRIVAKALANEGLDAAVKQYYELKKNQPDAYDFREALLNNFGYSLLNTGKIAEAVRIFQLNVEAYPASANVYDSLAEGYMRKGEKALAIENYEKALKLNPENTNAVEMLKKLKAQ
jgi:tetratricopeptide (TPR) repeat protein